MNFLGMGPMELMVILVLALIIFGPGKLPEIAGQVGRVVRDFRRTTAELSSEFNRTLSLEIEERKAAEAPAPPAPVSATVPPPDSYAVPSAPVAESVAPAFEPAEAPPIETSPSVAVTTSGSGESSLSGTETAVGTAPAGATKRRTYDADLAPPY